MPKTKEQYFILTDLLEKIIWSLRGYCDDIDCDKYMYKEILRKKYQPVLKHKISCIEKLEREERIILEMLADKKFRKYRYEKCIVCKKPVDTLNENNKIVSYTRPSKMRKGYSEWQGVWTHLNCSTKIKIPMGWKRF